MPATNMPDMHLWGKCASTQATYEVAPFNNVARITVLAATNEIIYQDFSNHMS